MTDDLTEWRERVKRYREEPGWDFSYIEDAGDALAAELAAAAEACDGFRYEGQRIADAIDWIDQAYNEMESRASKAERERDALAGQVAALEKRIHTVSVSAGGASLALDALSDALAVEQRRMRALAAEASQATRPSNPDATSRSLDDGWLVEEVYVRDVEPGDEVAIQGR